MRTLLVTRWQGKKLLTVIEDEKAMEFILCYDEGQLGSIHKGVVTTIKRNLRACFVDIGHDEIVFLRETDCLNFATLRVGDEVLVQITSESTGYKRARATMKLSFIGHFLIYSPYTNYVAASKKLSTSQREQWLEYADKILENDEGVIFRTAVEKATPEQVGRELKFLRESMNRIVQKGRHRKAQGCLQRGPDCLGQAMSQYSSLAITQIQTDDNRLYEQMIDVQNGTKLSQTTKIVLIEKVPLDLDAQISQALKRIVWLEDGSYLLIEEGEALTAIDVNSGSSSLPLQQINLKAAKEAMRQLRLRNIGGMIVIDFIRSRDATSSVLLQEAIEEAVKGDVNTVKVFGFTKMGLFELTRKKVRRSLKEAVSTLK